MELGAGADGWSAMPGHGETGARSTPPTHAPTGYRLRRSPCVSRRRVLLTTDTVGGVWDFSVTLTSGLRAALGRADAITAVSQFLADEVRDLYDILRPLEVIHNGWPAPAPLSPTRGGFTVVAGRVWDAAKNVALVAEAAQGWDPGGVYL